MKLMRDGVWAAINAVMAVIFLLWSSTLWLEPQLTDVPGASGGAQMVFVVIVVQLLGPLLLLNLAWLGVAAWKSLPRRDWTPVWLFAGMTLAWIGLVRFSASLVI